MGLHLSRLLWLCSRCDLHRHPIVLSSGNERRAQLGMKDTQSRTSVSVKVSSEPISQPARAAPN